VRHNLAIALHSAKDYAKATQELKAVISSRPNWPEPHLTLARIYQRLGLATQAVEEYRTALRVGPDSAKARYRLGQLLEQAGKVSEAEEEFRKAVRLEPSNGSYRYSLARALKQLGREADAEKEFTQTTSLKEQDLLGELAASANRSAVTLAEKGQVDAAPNFPSS
jgi:Flp pilus assembly protein TadD